MYEAVDPFPAGESTVSRYAITAADYGFDGIVVRETVDRQIDYNAERIEEAYRSTVVDAVEIRTADPSRASGYLGSIRSDATIVLVRGGTAGLNRFAVNQDRVDVLTRPTTKGGEFDHGLARAATEHEVRIELSLGPVLRSTGGERVRAIADLRRLWRVVDGYDVPYVVSGRPTSHLELRGPRELAAAGDAIGLDREAVEEGLTEWRRIAIDNRQRLSDDVVAPGVERTSTDTREPKAESATDRGPDS